MTSKRILGFIFILLASILTLAIFGRLPVLFGAISGFFKIFTGKLDSSQIGAISGHIIYWIFQFIATIALWKYGIKWSKKEIEV
jgi:hypothetical protein